jgi:hypothetical protein
LSFFVSSIVLSILLVIGCCAFFVVYKVCRTALDCCFPSGGRNGVVGKEPDGSQFQMSVTGWQPQTGSHPAHPPPPPPYTSDYPGYPGRAQPAYAPYNNYPLKA